MRPQRLEIYFVAIGGTGMAPLACLLREQGHRIRGADGPLYPPMSTLLARHGIEPLLGFDPRHLEPAPDLVIVGNAVPRSNPEALEAERLELPRISMPQALARFFLDGRRPLVVAGTHGKTTTASMAAWVYTACHRDPGFLIGGMPRNLPASFRRGAGSRFIVEGDEYNAAYFDRGPKFLHYRPETVILTSVEYDHADLYADPAALIDAYRALVDLLPDDGLLVACGDSPEVRELAARATCQTILYGLAPHNEVRPEGAIEATAEGSRLRLRTPGGVVTVELPLTGDHNVSNALAVWSVALRDGLEPDRVAAALGQFQGVSRRMEEVGVAAGITVIDDFAHHPTAVAHTLRALRQRYPGSRLVALFEPRSLTAGRAFFFEAYREAFRAADRVLFAPVYHAARLEAGERLDLDRLAAALGVAGVPAAVCADVDDLLVRALGDLRSGDVAITMSSGDFRGLPRRLLAALGTSQVAAEAGAGSRDDTAT